MLASQAPVEQKDCLTYVCLFSGLRKLKLHTSAAAGYIAMLTLDEAQVGKH